MGVGPAAPRTPRGHRTAQLCAHRLQRLTNLASLSQCQTGRSSMLALVLWVTEQHRWEKAQSRAHTTSAVQDTSAYWGTVSGPQLFCSCTLYTLSAAIVLRARFGSIYVPKKRQQFNGQNTALQRNALPKASEWVLCLFSFENKQIHIPGNSWSKFPRQQSETKGEGPQQGGHSSAGPGRLQSPAWARPTSTPQGTSPMQSCPRPQAASIQ